VLGKPKAVSKGGKPKGGKQEWQQWEYPKAVAGEQWPIAGKGKDGKGGKGW
jgi:hypothetical protein